MITALIAEYYLTEHPGGEIIYDLRSSRVVPETIGRMGGIAVRSRVGHSFIKERMRGDNALFAGELSGHYYYKDTGFTDNALFTMIRMLGILSKKKEKLSKIMAAFETYCASGEINLKTTKAEAVYRDLERVFRDADQDHLDGLTITLEDWWFNLRASNTEPLMRLNLEAMAPDMVKQRLNDVLTLIRKADPDLEVIN